MNKKTFEYKLYQMILESDISDRDRKILLEAGIFQRIGDWFGAGKDLVSAPLGTLFSDAKYSRRLQTAQKNMEKEIQQLKDVGRDAKKDEKQVVIDFLRVFLAGQGISAAALAQKPKETEPSKETGGNISGQELPAGTPVSPTSPDFLQMLAQLIADASGKKVQDVADEANKKKVDAKSMTLTLAQACSKATGVKTDSALKVVTALLKTGHFILPVVEGLIRKMIKSQGDSNLIFERWEQLAGLLNEDAYSNLASKIDSGEISAAEVLVTRMKKYGKELRPSADQMSDLMDKLIAKKAVTPAEAEEAVEAVVDELPATGTAAEQGQTSDMSDADQAEAAEALQKFKAAAAKVRGIVKVEEVDEATLGAILNYFDDLDAIKQ